MGIYLSIVLDQMIFPESKYFVVRDIISGFLYIYLFWIVFFL